MSKKPSGMKTVFGLAAIASLLFTLASPTLSDRFSTAHAGDTNAAKVSRPPQNKVLIPFKDVRKAEIDGVRMLAAIKSNDAQAIIFRGSDQGALNETIKAVADAISEGKPIKRFYIATADPKVPNSIEFYVDGELSETILNPHVNVKNVAADVKNRLDRDYNETLTPRLASVGSPVLAQN